MVTCGKVARMRSRTNGMWWGTVDGAQRPMMHVDFQVGDLDAAVADAVALGARLLIDPAGHPFCLCLDE